MLLKNYSIYKSFENVYKLKGINKRYETLAP